MRKKTGSGLPRKRSTLRVYMGWVVYNILRSLQWILRYKEYTSLQKSLSQNPDSFKNIVFSHQTPLFRQLKNTEMWMQENKVHNLKLAVEKMNGLILNPGKSLSYWKLIGAPTRFRGFKKGMVLVNGTVQSKTGGGLCQLSNLIYWMTLHTPLTVTERFRHSYDVFPDSSRTQPFGSGATCVYKYRDLQIKNEYVEPMRLSLFIEEGFLKGSWLSEGTLDLKYDVYEKKHWFSEIGSGQYLRNNILHRKCFSDNKMVEDLYITENHALMMYSPLLSQSEDNQSYEE